MRSSGRRSKRPTTCCPTNGTARCSTGPSGSRGPDGRQDLPGAPCPRRRPQALGEGRRAAPDQPPRREAGRRAAGLPIGVPLTGVFSSSYVRCVQTMGPLAASSGSKLEVEPTIVEDAAPEEFIAAVGQWSGQAIAMGSHGDLISEHRRQLAAEGSRWTGRCDATRAPSGSWKPAKARSAPAATSTPCSDPFLRGSGAVSGPSATPELEEPRGDLRDDVVEHLLVVRPGSLRNLEASGPRRDHDDRGVGERRRQRFDQSRRAEPIPGPGHEQLGTAMR